MKGDLNYKAAKKTGGKYPVIPVEKTKDSSNNEIDNNNDTLVFLDDRRKKKIDETIDSPDRYVSRYHYDSKNLDKYLELCPHCRKPTLYSYRKVVIDSALNYLEEKEEQSKRHVNRSMYMGLTAVLLVISAGLYYVLVHVLSGARV
jgi:hypothetical protein